MFVEWQNRIAPALKSYMLLKRIIIYHLHTLRSAHTLHTYRVDREKVLEAHLIATAAEKKRQGKLRRARERESRKVAALEKARHEEEMARIER